MKTDLSKKSITTDICVSVWVTQTFEVPSDYQIKGATSKEAYENLIAEYGEQNVDAIQEPFELDFDDAMSISFEAVGEEFIQRYNGTKRFDVKCFKCNN